jgi:hypothetical protein
MVKQLKGGIKMEEQIEKKSFVKKKLLGLPVLLIVLLGIGLVAATGTYFFWFQDDFSVLGVITYPFIELPHPHNSSNELIVQKYLAPVLNCLINQPCYSEMINITNPTLDNQTVVISHFEYLDGEGLLYITPTTPTALGCYEEESHDASMQDITFRDFSDLTLDNLCSSELTLILPAKSETSFRMAYTMLELYNATSFTSNVKITSNMTEY